MEQVSTLVLVPQVAEVIDTMVAQAREILPGLIANLS